jgi:hypothetical protein
MAVVALAVAAAAAPAAASPDDVVARPLVLPRFGVEASAVLEMNLSTGRSYEPSSLAPDVWFGVTDDVTVGVVHSARALSIVDSGLGYCFRDEAHGCAAAYDNLGVDARWSLVRGELSAAARARFVVRTFDPWKPRLGAGGLVRWQRGRFAISSDPSLSIGLANRDRGNRAALDVPLWFAVQPTCRWALHLRSGVHGSLVTYGDTYEIPMGLGVTVSPHRLVDISAEAAFRRLLGPQNDFKTRAMWIAVTGRWP